MKEYRFDHIVRSVDSIFKGASFDCRVNEVIFSWNDHHSSVSRQILEDDLVGDIDIAKMICRDFVDLSITI